jgi:hypothetical protein
VTQTCVLNALAERGEDIYFVVVTSPPLLYLDRDVKPVS